MPRRSRIESLTLQTWRQAVRALVARWRFGSTPVRANATEVPLHGHDWQEREHPSFHLVCSVCWAELWLSVRKACGRKPKAHKGEHERSPLRYREYDGRIRPLVRLDDVPHCRGYRPRLPEVK